MNTQQAEEDLTHALALIGAAIRGAQETCSSGVLDLLFGAEALLERALGAESLTEESLTEESALVS